MNATTYPQLLAAPVDPSFDTDPQETREWRDAFTALVAAQGPIHARQILDSLVALSREQRVGGQPAPADG